MQTDFSDTDWGGPELKSNLGPAHIWKVYFEDTFKEDDGTEFVKVHYCVKNEGWGKHFVYSGYWKKTYITKLLES